MQHGPCDLRAERVVLGACMNSKHHLEKVLSRVNVSDFYDNKHRKLFLHIADMASSQSAISVDTLASYLSAGKFLSEVGGIELLFECHGEFGTSADVSFYLDRVVSYAAFRRAVQFTTRSSEEFKDPVSFFEKMVNLQSKVYAELSESEEDAACLIGKCLDGSLDPNGLDFVERLKKKREMYQLHGESYIGENTVETGFKFFDKNYLGLSESTLNILAARPAMGKTAFALKIALHAASSNVPVCFFSLEMSKNDLTNRAISSLCHIPLQNLIKGSINLDKIETVQAAKDRLNSGSFPLYLDDNRNAQIENIKIRCRHMVKHCKCKLIIIDYLQLINQSSRSESRQVEISSISRELKLLSGELNVPILCLSQLSRKVEERNNKTPLLSDLRESGSIEQDADKVMFLMRRDYYDPLDKPGLAELIIAKNRSGPTGCVSFNFDKEYVDFTDFDPFLHSKDSDNNAFNEFSP